MGYFKFINRKIYMFSVDSLIDSIIYKSFNLNHQLRWVGFHLLRQDCFIRKVAAFLFKNQDLFCKFLFYKFFQPLNIVFFVHYHICKRFVVLNYIFPEFVQTMPIDTNHTVKNLYLPGNGNLLIKFATRTIIFRFSFEDFSLMDFMANQTTTI